MGLKGRRKTQLYGVASFILCKPFLNGSQHLWTGAFQQGDYGMILVRTTLSSQHSGPWMARSFPIQRTTGLTIFALHFLSFFFTMSFTQDSILGKRRR